MPYRCNNAAQAESNKAERHAVLSFVMKAGDGDALPQAWTRLRDEGRPQRMQKPRDEVTGGTRKAIPT